jgi:transcription antitermination factor NusG
MGTVIEHQTVSLSDERLPLHAILRSEWPWFALRVREKFRVVTEDMLSAQGITFFSPTTTDLRQWSDRVRAIVVPLFAGYLFCSFDPRNQLTILRTMGVIDIVRSGSQLATVDHRELDAICTALRTTPHVTAIPYLAHGQKVRVVEGPLRDVVGILTEVKSRCTLVLAVTMMNRSVAVQIDRTLVEPL